MKKPRLKTWSRIKKWYLSYKKLDTVLQFGKYKDKSIKQIVDRDVQYIEWCLIKRIFRLNWFAKPYYLKKLNYQRKLRHKFLIEMYKLEQKYGVWMDDGQGHCGFVKREEC